MTWREEEGRGKEEGRMAVKINIKIHRKTYEGMVATMRREECDYFESIKALRGNLEWKRG